jgi:hypothetical protein
MSKISDLKLSREAAGRRYKAAAEELREAYVALGALDGALANAAGEPHFQTFAIQPDPWALAHPVFLSYDTYGKHLVNWHDEIQLRRDRYIAAARA